MWARCHPWGKMRMNGFVRRCFYLRLTAALTIESANADSTLKRSRRERKNTVGREEEEEEEEEGKEEEEEKGEEEEERRRREDVERRRGGRRGRMERVWSRPLSRVALCGGTHGNELCGVYMLKEMQETQQKRSGSFSLTTVLANPRAVDVCRRYTENDLNRCFTDALLSAPITEATPYEVRRAQELSALLGPRGSEEAVDLVCDLHSTTANMGVCLISHLTSPVGLHLFKYLQEKITSAPVRLILLKTPLPEIYSLESLGKHGIAIEVGPQPHGVLRADVYNLMREAVDRALEWTESFNSGTVFEGGEVEVYIVVDKKDYPRDPETQQLTAAIHPQLQDNDFCLLKPGDPAFMSFSGETICYEGEELYPIFVNEGAYYEKKTAFQLSRKESLLIPSISVKKEQ
ncbi:N-acyl-aromatic-L-amino acid amidohydrolase (carboxylate-forming) A [Merluccius polli]|uniref:N-acyl-aromatic-L-amino acid amidohydrolase n=1 Tax=Merluccius polli TaxID=89951 RepID=A0AA47N9C8_MERPO|nr:N-acyl-aromatic-L-amino acid amidohydrolase (carboxylate-forming) A [Merluccius polli]